MKDEKFYDSEWEEAWNKDESTKYYYLRLIPHTGYPDGRVEYLKNYIKCYKPSVAALIIKRLGLGYRNDERFRHYGVLEEIKRDAN